MDWRSSPECTELMPPMDDFSNSLSEMYHGKPEEPMKYSRQLLRRPEYYWARS